MARENEEFANIPQTICSEAELDELLSRPTPATIEVVSRLDGDFLILGVGGKMGPSLARMLARALEACGRKAQVYGVGRFSDRDLPAQLASWRVSSVACDLVDPDAVRTLPTAANVFYLVGRKFGQLGTEPSTWAINTALPLHLASLFREAQRIVAFSTGCVYPLVPVDSAGSNENDPLCAVGEYGWSAVGRERVFQFLCDTFRIPTLLYRLNYAQALRYGVLTDIAVAIQREQPVSLRVPAVNIIWQGDANNYAIRCLEEASVPAKVLNITGREKLLIRDVAHQMGKLLGISPQFEEPEGRVAYLSDASLALRRFGAPQVSPAQMIQWTAEWVKRNLPILDKPTHYDVTDGQFLD